MEKITNKPKEDVESLDLYIDRLLEQSFEGWSEDAKSGYITAMTSVKMKIANGTKTGAIAK